MGFAPGLAARQPPTQLSDLIGGKEVASMGTGTRCPQSGHYVDGHGHEIHLGRGPLPPLSHDGASRLLEIPGAVDSEALANAP